MHVDEPGIAPRRTLVKTLYISNFKQYSKIFVTGDEKLSTSPILKFTHVKNIVFQIYELHTLNSGTSKPLVKNLLKMLTQNFALQNSRTYISNIVLWIYKIFVISNFTLQMIKLCFEIVGSYRLVHPNNVKTFVCINQICL